MTKQENAQGTGVHLAFEQLIFDAFRQRNEGKIHWSDGLLHVASHEQIPKIACHHQHSQYHVVLFWLENFFANAARWVGVRELARLALDFLENSKTTFRDAETAAYQFVDSLSAKREHQSVAQLECLMRCGLTVWKLRSAPWRQDLAQISKEKGFSVMTLVEHQQAAVVGHSMGSLIALACAARAPDRIRALALLGTAFPMQVSAAFLAAAKANAVDAFDMETIWGHAPEVPFASNPNPGMWMYGDTLARLSRLAPGVLHTDLQSCNDYQGGLTAAAQIRCPTLLIAGERDMMTPPKASATLAQSIAGVQVVRLAQSGHSMMAEAPDAILDALIKFLTPLA
ncbi:alpha/beta hydrolase [bacterium]|nr:alpha/beta hydrolase [bacterium]